MLASAAAAQTTPTESGAPPTSLAVPFLPQSEELCGGAAVAMVFRYWGDAHAAVAQFEPLVDRKAGGIAGGVLVNAITERGWNALHLAGSISTLREQLALGRPIIILLEDRPRTYHYVVVVGLDVDAVVVHDPSWGPSRRIATGDLIRVWQPSGFWSVVVLPSDAPTARPVVVPATRPRRPAMPCDTELNEAVAQIRGRGLGEASAILVDVRAKCPNAAGPIRELAGVRFAERRWGEAESLAAEATRRDPDDDYAWEILAASRFVQDDTRGALLAWNQVGKPQIDLVNITGLARARYALIAEAIDLAPNTMLTPARVGRAARRLSELPDTSAVRLSYRPASDGFAVVDAAIVERQRRPQGLLAWGTAATATLINREIEINWPGSTGQGEVWSARWRWWNGRPRVALSFAAPRVGWLHGIWRVDVGAESERYLARGIAPEGALFTERRTHGGVSVSDWLTSSIRYQLNAALDRWSGNRRTVAAGFELESRSVDDRLAVVAALTSHGPLGSGTAFHSGRIALRATPFTTPTGLVLSTTAGASAVSHTAPLALWPGADVGHARPALLRAHPLLDDGTISGTTFGRTLLHGNVELQRWFNRPSPVRTAVVVFSDLARASRRQSSLESAPTHIDVGVGFRLRLPTAGTLRADIGRGMRDRAMAVSVGWQH
jgi:hypothetical protein